MCSCAITGATSKLSERLRYFLGDLSCKLSNLSFGHLVDFKKSPIELVVFIGNHDLRCTARHYALHHPRRALQ